MIKQKFIMAKVTKTREVLIGFSIFVVIGLLIWLAVMYSQQQTAWQEAREEDVPISLIGKAATVSVFAYDQAANNPQTSKVAVPLYLIRNPTVTDTKISGQFLADGTVLSASSRTDVTEGLKVGDKILGVAVNATYYGVPNSVREMTGQSEILDLDVYATISSGNIVLKDEDETTITVGGGAVNLTLGSSETEVFNYLRVKNNNTNTGWNVAGFFIDTTETTNISTFSGSGTTEGSVSIGYAKDSDFGLERVTTDDVMFTLTEPVMLLEYDYLKFNNIQVKADADGCAAVDSGETFTIYVFDKTWDRSSKENALIYVAEDDTDSPADVGASDVSAAFICDAG